MMRKKLSHFASIHYPYLIHLVAISLLLLISLFVSAATTGKHIPSQFFLNTVWQGFAINMVFFYAIYGLLVKRLFSGRLLLSICILITYVAFCGLCIWLDISRMHTLEHAITKHHPVYFTIVNAFVKAFFALSALLIYAIIRLIKQRQQYNAIKLNTLQTELTILKGQTNPHFLFNTLNALYSKAFLSQQTELAEHIGQLSALMQYTFTQSNKSLVNLEQEIDHIEAYIALQKLRVGNNANITFDYGPISDKQKVPPMLLNPLVENACKYGLIDHPSSFVKVEMHISDNMLNISVANSNCSQEVKNSSAYVPSGTGIKNLKRRLTLLFADNFEFNVNEQNNTYAVRLSIPCH